MRKFGGESVSTYFHRFNTEDCSARPYEKDSDHGARNSRSPLSAKEFIVLRLIVASSSLWPPDKNMIPGTAGGTTCLIVRSVCNAISSAVARVSQLAPGIII